MRLALKVEQIERTVSALGLEISPIVNDRAGARVTFTADPDGLPIELHE